MSSDLISIVCVTYNSELTIRRCIDSILAQNYSNFEIIIQDCCSDDKTLEILKGYSCNIDVVSEKYFGKNEGLRKAIQRTKGRILSFCDPHMMYLANAFSDAIKFFHTNPDVSLLFRDIDVVDNFGKKIRSISYDGIDACKFITDASKFKLQHCFIYLNSRTVSDEYKRFKNSTATSFDKAHFIFITRLLLECSTSIYLPRTAIRSTNQSEGIYSAISIYMNCLERVHVLGYMLGGSSEMKEVSFNLRKLLYYNSIKKIEQMGREDLVCDLQRRLQALEEGVSIEFIPLAFLEQYAYDAPNDLSRLHRLALALYKQGQIDEALEYWEKTKDLMDNEIETIRLSANMFSPQATAKSLYREHLEWYNRVVKPLMINFDDNFLIDFEHRRIRIGYACTYWNTATIRFQLLSWMKHHDTSRFEIFVYYRNDFPNDMPENIEHFRHATNIKGSQFINMVREDMIDILIEVNGFTLGNFFVEMASRCAPIQVSYLNYTSTCGIPAVDNIIGDDIACPIQDDQFFTENIYRVPGCFFCFSYESEVVPFSEMPPIEKNGYVTFGCFGSGMKFNNEIIALWSKLLMAIPNSILVLQNNEMKPESVQQYFKNLFLKHGIPQNRLVLLPGTDRVGILENYKSVDISLDTWPYCGGNTIAESLWCGVPVISLKGSRFSSAYGSSLLSASGCPELIAQNPEEYVQIAVKLAADKARLHYYRKNLRSMMYQYGFSDTKAFAVKMETAYIDMLRSKVQSASITPKYSVPEISTNILLSVVMIGRNDNFRMDYIYRIETAINFLSKSLKDLDALNLVEIVIVDSGSEIPFSDVLTISTEAAKITKFIYVDPEILAKRAPRKSFLNTPLLGNIGIRRSSGKFILYTDTDCLMPPKSLSTLLSILNKENPLLLNPENYLFNMQRFQIPRQLVARRPSVDEWNRLIPYMGGCFRPEYLAANTVGGNSAGHVLSRNVWHELRGYDEEMLGDWGWHDDALMLRICQTYNWVNLVVYGVYSFHMEHEKMPAEHTTSKIWNETVIHAAQAVNDHSWGLGDNSGVVWQQPQKVKDVIDAPPYSLLSLKTANCINLNSVVQDEEIIDFLKLDVLPLIHPTTWKVPVSLQDVLPIIVAYARQEAPLSIITYGEMHPSFIMTVVITCPAIEMMICQPWVPGVATDDDVSPPNMYMWILEQAEYKGHSRIILGDFATSLERVYKYRRESSLIEMACLNAVSISAEFEIIIRQLLPKIAPGGMVVIVNIDDKIIARLTKFLQSSPASYRLELVNYDRSSAILFKLS